MRVHYSMGEIFVIFGVGVSFGVFIMIVTLVQFKLVDYMREPVYSTNTKAHEYLYENKLELKTFKE